MKKRVIFLLLIFASIGLTGCNNNNKLSEKEIKEKIEVKSEERTFTVNEVIYATNKININEINMEVNDNKITLGDYTATTTGETNDQITGYYDQPSAQYYIYRLSKDDDGKTTVWEMIKNETDDFSSVGWVNKFISNATDLILIDCTETMDPVGQTPLRYQVYALVDNELVLIN